MQAFKYYSASILNVQFKQFFYIFMSHVIDYPFFCLEPSLLHHYYHRINRLGSNRWISICLFLSEKFLAHFPIQFGAVWLGWLANHVFLFTWAFIPLASTSLLLPLFRHLTFDLGGLFMFGDVVAWPEAERLVGLLRIL